MHHLHSLAQVDIQYLAQIVQGKQVLQSAVTVAQVVIVYQAQLVAYYKHKPLVIAALVVIACQAQRVAGSKQAVIH
jgi:hypothetical protein